MNYHNWEIIWYISTYEFTKEYQEYVSNKPQVLHTTLNPIITTIFYKSTILNESVKFNMNHIEIAMN